MTESPNFRMQCPKCHKEFPFDTTYCEGCSAMLEPVEVAAPAEQPAGPATEAKKAAEEKASRAISAENMEDIKIDTLKADIENKFLFTVLLELEQFRARLSKKEKVFADLQEKQAGMGYEEFVRQTGKSEAEIDDLMKKITKLEMIIENLETTIVRDIAWFGERMQGMKEPAFLERFDHRGRYYRMLATELKVKRILLDIIRGKVSRSYFRTRRLIRMSLLIAFSVVMSLIVSWVVITYSQKRQPEVAAPQPVPAAPAAVVSEQEIRSLLDDMRTANMKKDLRLWESRYSQGYLELKGKRESIQEQWKKYDYTSLAYTIEDLRVRSDGAEAVIVWKLGLQPRKSGAPLTVTQKLRCQFVPEGGRLKIASVIKEDR
ncbi:MAG: hypothetical protein EPN25_00940 [Nitrospirae bacterium]|nr:MAG: hypothetical protein EPN25_00940 [Nitrospirota bacterium]